MVTASGEMALATTGAERGAREEPASDSIAFDDVENRIIERIEAEKNGAHGVLLDELRTYKEGHRGHRTYRRPTRHQPCFESGSPLGVGDLGKGRRGGRAMGPTMPGSGLRARWRWSRCWPPTRGSGPFASCHCRAPNSLIPTAGSPAGTNRVTSVSVDGSKSGCESPVERRQAPSQPARAPIMTTWAASQSR